MTANVAFTNTRNGYNLKDMETEAMQWYLSLDINLRINAKTCFELLTGIRFEDLSFMFSFKERLGMMYNKLKLEGFQL